MPKTTTNSFNAGELSPYMYARSDFEKYRSGCLVMENFVPLPYGGATRRPAIKYLGDTKADGKVRLIPFTASVDASYVLELGDGYLRVWKDGVLMEDDSLPVEIGTPWGDDDLNCIKFAQSVDVMWFVHPNYPPQRVSRFSDTFWTIVDEKFDFPPLLDENTTDIEIATSAIKGEATLTSSQDFFNEGHVGGYMSFTSMRTDSDKSVDTVNVWGTSDPLYVSSANWEFSTTGTFRGAVTIQRSFDGVTWEDYIDAGNTLYVADGGQRQFQVSSDNAEPIGVRLRIRYTALDGSFNFQLKTEDKWSTLVKITNFTDERTVTAEIIDEFQDIPSDYSVWQAGGTYSRGDKVKVEADIGYTANNYATGLADATGGSYGGGSYWVTTSNATNRKLHELSFNGSAFTVENTYDLSSDFELLADVAFYNGFVYLTGSTSTNNAEITRYTTAGVRVEVVKTANNDIDWTNIVPTGLEYTTTALYWGLEGNLNGDFYSFMRNYNPSTLVYSGYGFSYTNKGSGWTEDMANANNLLINVSSNNDKFQLFGESGSDSDYKRSVQILPAGLNPKGLIADADNLWIVNSDGIMYQYLVTPNTGYYECMIDHTTSSSFNSDLNNGIWAERDPSTTSWTEGAFSGYRGFPSSIALFESRLCFGGTRGNPDTIWLSQIDDFTNFQLNSLDTGALKLTLGSGSIDQIRWMVPQERLVIGTAGAEWSIGASEERKPVTPTGFDLKRKTTYGSNNVQGLLVNSAVLFIMRQGKKVREWTPSYNAQDYVASDLSILSEHITKGGICEFCYQQQPDSILWSIRNDGTLLGLTYERDQNVSGWHRHANESFDFESVTVIPKDNAEDQIYVSVNVDGKRKIGRINNLDFGEDYTTEWQGSDLWINYQTEGDLIHLAGKTVDIVVDGVIQPQEVVSVTGGITATLGTNNIVGLPFTSTLSPVYLNSANEYGTSQGSKTSVRTGTIRFKDTFSAKVGQTEESVESVKFDKYKAPLHSEDAEVWFENSSDFLQTCYIVQDEPMPCTVLALIAKQEVNQ